MTCREDFSAERDLENDLGLIRAEAVVFGGLGNCVLPCHAVTSLLGEMECNAALGGLFDDLVHDGEVDLC